MTAAAVSDFASRAAMSRLSVFGTDVVFRGGTVRAIISRAAPALNLESGGFREGATWRLRLPASLQPPPAPLEVFTELSGAARTFYVESCIAADGNMYAEHIVEARQS
jgi:hypothetical protein